MGLGIISASGWLFKNKARKFLKYAELNFQNFDNGLILFLLICWA
jgi:hypothetical protein